jgi:hypothetical protein
LLKQFSRNLLYWFFWGPFFLVSKSSLKCTTKVSFSNGFIRHNMLSNQLARMKQQTVLALKIEDICCSETSEFLPDYIPEDSTVCTVIDSGWLSDQIYREVTNVRQDNGPFIWI